MEGPALHGKGKAVGLTEAGIRAQDDYQQKMKGAEKYWRSAVGAESINALMSRVSGIDVHAVLNPYPDSWRAKIPAPLVLLHFPMVLHRGGYPDGA